MACFQLEAPTRRLSCLGAFFFFWRSVAAGDDMILFSTAACVFLHKMGLGLRGRFFQLNLGLL